jgi:hypothetical protein
LNVAKPGGSSVARQRGLKMKVNLSIAGHQISLEPGHYIACRPMASRKRQTFPVTIYDVENDMLRQRPIITIPNLSYDQANEFINEFNNGPTSWDGRIIK